MMSTKPESYAVGKLVIPLPTFWAWAQTNLPGSMFYTMGRVSMTPEVMEVAYSCSSEGVPPPPEQVLAEKVKEVKEKK
jgi:hypothetical protein